MDLLDEVARGEPELRDHEVDRAVEASLFVLRAVEDKPELNIRQQVMHLVQHLRVKAADHGPADLGVCLNQLDRLLFKARFF